MSWNMNGLGDRHASGDMDSGDMDMGHMDHMDHSGNSCSSMNML